MHLADRINRIIREQNMSKAEFARQVGVTVNYIYILTGKRCKEAERSMTISPALAKLIALRFGYSEEWILYGGQEDHQFQVTGDTTTKS